MSYFAVPHLYSSDTRRRVERCHCVHETLPRLQSASSWHMVEQLVSGICR